MTRGNTTSKQDIDRQITQKRKHCRTTRWKRPMNNTKCTTARNKIETTTDIMQWRRRQWHHWQSMHMTRTHTTKTRTVGAPPQTCKPFVCCYGNVPQCHLRRQPPKQHVLAPSPQVSRWLTSQPTTTKGHCHLWFCALSNETNEAAMMTPSGQHCARRSSRRRPPLGRPLREALRLQRHRQEPGASRKLGNVWARCRHQP